MPKKRGRREASSYLESARELAKFIPSLKKYKNRKTLSSWEKAAISRKEHLVRGVYNLRPLTKKQAKDMSRFLYQPTTAVKKGPNRGKLIKHSGIQAVQAANTAPDAKFIPINRDAYSVLSNDRVFVHWGLPDTRPRTLRRAAEQAFENPESNPEEYDIEKVIELARKAFEHPQTKGVYLWTENGRVGNPMKSLAQFARWIVDDYSQYKETERWVRGISILVADVGEKISSEEWATFGKPPVREQQPRRRRR